MSDRLTKLQEAVDALAQQFACTINYVISHHDLDKLNPNDKIQASRDQQQQDVVEPHDPELFASNLRELAHDLFYKEQQIEMLISLLPGLDNSEDDQKRTIMELERQLRTAEMERQAAIEEKRKVQRKVDDVIRSITRP